MVFACTKLGKIAGMLNLALYQGILLRPRVPKSLVPRRKYEVDESMRLVQFGLPKVKMMMKGSQKLITLGRDARENYLPGRQELAGFGRSAHGTIGRQLQKPVLFFQWGRVPKDWELSFVSTMKMAESQGIPFRGGPPDQSACRSRRGTVGSASEVGRKKRQEPTQAIRQSRLEDVRPKRKENSHRP